MNTLKLIIFTSLLGITSQVKSQYLCFWVANYSEETFSTLKIRENGDSYFGRDLLPEYLINPGEHFWVRTYNSGSSIYDVEITRLDGEPLRFKWTGESGKTYNRPYITLDILPLNTLMISSDDYGNTQWDISNSDIYGFCDPCDP
jgi:hypothetical protein